MRPIWKPLLEDEVLLNEQGIVPKRDDVRLSVREVLAFPGD